MHLPQSLLQPSALQKWLLFENARWYYVLEWLVFSCIYYQTGCLRVSERHSFASLSNHIEILVQRAHVRNLCTKYKTVTKWHLWYIISLCSADLNAFLVLVTQLLVTQSLATVTTCAYHEGRAHHLDEAVRDLWSLPSNTLLKPVHRTTRQIFSWRMSWLRFLHLNVAVTLLHAPYPAPLRRDKKTNCLLY